MPHVSPEELPHDFGWIDGSPDPRDKRISELEIMLRRVLKDAHQMIGEGYRTHVQMMLYAEADRLLMQS